MPYETLVLAWNVEMASPLASRFWRLLKMRLELGTYELAALQVCINDR